jgi:hypothetical protein
MTQFGVRPYPIWTFWTLNKRCYYHRRPWCLSVSPFLSKRVKQPLISHSAPLANHLVSPSTADHYEDDGDTPSGKRCAFQLRFKSCTRRPDTHSNVPCAGESQQVEVSADRTVSISSTLAHVIMFRVSNRILLLTFNIHLLPTSYSLKPLSFNFYRRILIRLFHLIQGKGNLLALAPQRKTRYSPGRISIRRLGSGLAERSVIFC